jgi:hypothetical protein
MRKRRRKGGVWGTRWNPERTFEAETGILQCRGELIRGRLFYVVYDEDIDRRGLRF